MARALRGMLGRAARLFSGRASTAECAECCQQQPHAYCVFCPCDQPGCWAQRPKLYIRDDVLCTDGVTRVCTGASNLGEPVPLVRYGGWCYQPHAEAPVFPLPEGVVVIDPPARLECVPVTPPFEYPTNCDHPACAPQGTGDCECRDCAPGDNACACQHVCYQVLQPGCVFCCYGGRDPQGHSTATLRWTYRHVNRILNSPWGCDCHFLALGECGGESFRSVRTGTVDSILSRSDCTALVRFRIVTETFRKVRCGFTPGHPCPCENDNPCHCCTVTETQTEYFDELVSLADGAFLPVLANNPAILRPWHTPGGVEDCSGAPPAQCPDPGCADFQCFGCIQGAEETVDPCYTKRYRGRLRVADSGSAGQSPCCYRLVTEEIFEECTIVPGGGEDAASCCSMCRLAHCPGAGGGSGGRCTSQPGGDEGDGFGEFF